MCKTIIDTLRTFISGVVAGFLIFVASLLYTRCEERWVGAIFFGIGLVVILLLQLKLFTGTVGFVKHLKEIPSQLVILAGNIVGCLPALLFDCSSTIIDNKVSQPWYQMLIMGIICGMMIYIAVASWRSGFQWITVFAVGAFVLMGAEHCIADWCFLLMSRKFTIELAWFFPSIVIGNIAGAQLFRLVTPKS